MGKQGNWGIEAIKENKNWDKREPNVIKQGTGGDGGREVTDGIMESRNKKNKGKNKARKEATKVRKQRNLEAINKIQVIKKPSKVEEEYKT